MCFKKLLDILFHSSLIDTSVAYVYIIGFTLFEIKLILKDTDKRCILANNLILIKLMFFFFQVVSLVHRGLVTISLCLLHTAIS